MAAQDKTDGLIKMKSYTGNNSGAGPQKVTVKEVSRLAGSDDAQVREYELPLEPSLKLYSHSPDGFQWGSQGSGCAQTALAILLDLTGDKALSVALHQEFKRHLIATASKRLVITEPTIRRWLQVVSNKETNQ
ncbi:MAG TPA: DUF6166 domain-containing protein [Dehalococcoidia bacterium]|nr:DUF6166 domain-containing protein [Dehalococcoidia bacterium]